MPRWKSTSLRTNDPYRRTARFYDALTESPNAVLRRVKLEMPLRQGVKVPEVAAAPSSCLS
jgi:hypothetical protein